MPGAVSLGYRPRGFRAAGLLVRLTTEPYAGARRRTGRPAGYAAGLAGTESTEAVAPRP
ncbi:hypothetical protein ACFYY1_21840 [Streptomyces sp. NPDC001890]|uniref:hypothetical protein n=1 Tax=Streptomyces sp. NPDC001890 TaxID=3364620 RepID=UPI0036903C85